MAKSTTPRLGLTRWTQGTDSVRRLDFDTPHAEMEKFVAIYGQGSIAERPNAGKPGRFYWVTGDSQNNNGKLFYDNGSIWDLVGKYGEDVIITGSTGTSTPLTVIGGPTTEYVTRWMNTNNQTVGSINGSGEFRAKEVRSGTSQAGHVVETSANKPGLVVNNTNVSSTADMQQWINNTGKASYVDSTGRGYFKGLTSTSDLSVSGSTQVNGLTAAQRINTNGLTSSVTTGAAIVSQSSDTNTNNLLELRRGTTMHSRFDSNGVLHTTKVNVNTGVINGTTPTSGGAALNVSSAAAADTSLQVRAITGQTGAAVNVANVAGTSVFAISPTGVITSSADANFNNATVNSRRVNINNTATQSSQNDTPISVTGASKLNIASDGMSVYNPAGTAGADMRLQNSGGRLLLGSATNTVDNVLNNGMLKFKTHNVHFSDNGSYNNLTNAQINPNDWWFDAQANEIKVRDTNNTWKTIAGANLTVRESINFTPFISANQEWSLISGFTLINNRTITHSLIVRCTKIINNNNPSGILYFNEDTGRGSHTPGKLNSYLPGGTLHATGSLVPTDDSLSENDNLQQAGVECTVAITPDGTIRIIRSEFTVVSYGSQNVPVLRASSTKPYLRFTITYNY